MKDGNEAGAAAVIDKPAGATPSPDMPGGGEAPKPELRPSEKKFAELREKVGMPPKQERQYDLPPDPRAAGDDPAPPAKALPEGWTRDADGRVRNEKGDFAKIPAAGDEKKPAPDDDGDELPPAAEAGAAGADGADGAADDGAAAGELEPIVAKLPGRQPDDPDFELPLDRAALEEAGIDPDEAVERLNQLRNGALRRNQVAQALEGVQKQRAELDTIYESMEADPSGFLTTRVAPKLREKVAVDLLMSLDEEGFSRVVDRADVWVRKPDVRRTEATAAENARLKAERDSLREAGTRSDDVTTGTQIAQQIEGLIPDTMTDARADRFFRFATDELIRYAEQHRLESLDAAKVPQILSDLGVLDDFGLSPDGQPTRTTDGTGSADGARPAGSAPNAETDPTGEDAAERMRRRREAAATAPAGAGAGAAGGFKKVPGERHADRMARLKKSLRRG